MSDDEEARPAEEGFWCGLAFARMNQKPLPPNPYPLHTEERTRWSKGYVAGRLLGATQREHAERVAHIIHLYPDGGGDLHE
jgi:hypothetical protein